MNGLKEIYFGGTVVDYLKGSTLYSGRNSDDVDLGHVLDKYLLEQFTDQKMFCVLLGVL